MQPFLVSCARGLEELLFDELKTLGITELRRGRSAVEFHGELADAERVCLWSRVASRVLMPLDLFPAEPDALTRAVAAYPWEQHFDVAATLWIDFHGTSKEIRHTTFGAQRVKDGIVDRFQQQVGKRPSVDAENPDIRLSARLLHGKVELAIDLSGDGLHKRGYRTEQGQAPLRETLAAALLLRAGWPAIAAQGGALVDPMCGSGSFLVEGTWIAQDRAPGLSRTQWGFQKLKSFDASAWNALLAEAEQRAKEGARKFTAPVVGADRNHKMIGIARENVRRAGLAGRIGIHQGSVESFVRPDGAETGLAICNPPFGERMGTLEDVKPTWAALGEVLKSQFTGWQAALLTSDRELGKATGLHSFRQHAFYNGALECELLRFDLKPENFRRERAEGESAPFSEGAQMVANRLRKNARKLSGWLKNANTDCYRLYDADLPEYAAAIDIYGDWVHLQEYAPPATIEPATARHRVNEIRTAVEKALEIRADRIVVKQRKRQKGRSQYQRAEQLSDNFFEVHEDDARYWINLYDYLDTGLFLDHRPVRRKIRALASGKRFLNLFCYTATATVQAARGGAKSTVSVDLSNTYLDWARRNFELNGMTWGHRVERADCREWLADCDQQFDLILLDPPTFSNSKRMEGVLDTQRDHAEMIDHAMRCLAPEGDLLFSTNHRRFKLDDEIGQKYDVRDISKETLDPDFERNPKIHQCWHIRHKTGQGA